jgi:hypothetical protein
MVTRRRRDPQDPDSDAGIVRKLLPFERDFTQIPNAWLRDNKVSWRARGIRDYVLSHEPGILITLTELASPSMTPKSGEGEGIKGVRAAVEELENRGYLHRTPVRKGGRFIADRWELLDPTGLHDPALFGLDGLVDNPRRSPRALRAGSDHRVPSGHAYRVPSGHGIEKTIKNTRATPAAASPSASPDLWKTTLTSEPCSKPRGHSWPSLRAAHAEAAVSGGLVTCLNACGVQVSAALMDAAAAGMLS